MVQLFQFHSGSIKGVQLEAVVHTLLWFQFHSGSIKGTSARGLALSSNRRFNSTLVRLKGQAVGARNVRTLRVSIPLWFD